MTKIRWGLVGCGDVSRKRIANAIRNNPNSELLAGCRRDPGRLHEFCDEFAIPQRYTEVADLMNDPEIDAVYLATPVRQHLPHTLLAAAAGKHVLVEKPMAMSAAECDEMIRVCESANVRLGVAYYRRFYPLVQRIEQLLNDGMIGTPLGVSAVTSTPLAMHATDEGYWRTSLSEGGGGALMDVGSHRINLLLHLFGQAQTVKAICTSVAANYETEDAAVLVMRMSSGVVATLQCHFGAEDPDEFTILGTRGRLHVEPLNGATLSLIIDGQLTIEQHPPATNFCTPLVADFVTAIRECRPPKVDGYEGRATNQVMDAAYTNSTST